MSVNEPTPQIVGQIFGWIFVVTMIQWFFRLFIIVNEGEAYIIETLGKYSKTIGPGLHFVLPLVQKIRGVPEISLISTIKKKKNDDDDDDLNKSSSCTMCCCLCLPSFKFSDFLPRGLNRATPIRIGRYMVTCKDISLTTADLVRIELSEVHISYTPVNLKRYIIEFVDAEYLIPEAIKAAIIQQYCRKDYKTIIQTKTVNLLSESAAKQVCDFYGINNLIVSCGQFRLSNEMTNGLFLGNGGHELKKIREILNVDGQ